MVYLQWVKSLKKNGQKTKCNPAYMPLASFADVDAKENFSECIADIQSSMMSTFLGPMNATLSGILCNVETMNGMNSFRSSLAYVKNLIPAFQKEILVQFLAI